MQTGNLLYLSGKGPPVENGVRPAGKLGRDFSVEQGYAIARSFCELFREPDPQLGFLWGGPTMGMVLSLPLLLFGIVLIVIALRRPPLNAAHAV